MADLDLKTALSLAHESVQQAVHTHTVTQDLPMISQTMGEIRKGLRSHQKLYRQFELYGNAVLGMLSEIEDDADPTRQEWARLLSAVNHAYATLVERLTEMVDFNDVIRLSKFDKHRPDDKQAERTARYAREDHASLNSWKPQQHALEAGILRSGIFRGTAPIVTLMPFDQDKLLRRAVPYAKLAGYTVLTEQQVIGVSRFWVDNQLQLEADALDEGSLDKKKASPGLVNMLRKKSPEAKSTEWSKAHADYADSAVETLLAKNSSYGRMSENSFAYAGARWYWIVPKSMQATLRECTFGNSLKNANAWGFAFESRFVSRLHKG